MTGGFTQASRWLRATTPFPTDALVPMRIDGREAVSELFRYVVDFIHDETHTIDISQILGKSITIEMHYEDSVRYVNGIVRRFVHLGRDRVHELYRAELVPALWLLSLGNDCRTFENKTPLDIIEQICREGGVTEFQKKVTAPPAAIPYVVQYRESNLDFVSRLLEEAGLYYTFEHASGKHTLVISDQAGTSIPECALPTVDMHSAMHGEQPLDDTVFELTREYSLHTKKHDLKDHDLLRADSAGNVTTVSPVSQGERFDFLGDLGPNASSAEAKVRMEIEEATYDVVRGRSTVASFQAGRRVKVKTDMLAGDKQNLHLIEVVVRAGQPLAFAGSTFTVPLHNEFVAIPSATKFRPPRRVARPEVRGTQVAKVVGSGNEGEIDVDANGCILLEFPWDRGAGKDGASAHRVHVASVWGGKEWGFIQIPRIGQEVLVEYLEGDVDRPIVTGRVYNAQHKLPYALPTNKTQSGWKSRSVPNGAAENFNEIRFEDKKGEEHVSVQAEKDLMTLVKNDETRTVNHDRTTTIKNHDTREVTEGNDKHTIKKGNQTIEVSEGNQEITVKQGDQTIKVDTGKQTITVKADQSLTVDQGNRKTNIKMGNDDLEVGMGNMSIKVKMGNLTTKLDLGKVETEAMQSIELKVGQSSLKVDQMGVTIKGMMIKIEGQIQTEVKGLMTQIKGDAMLMAKGGITMIN